MRKYFNIAGPCFEQEHYMVSVENRCKEVMQLIRQKQYFVIHAARQTGKTTLVQHLAEQLTQSGQYYALYCSLESASVFTSDGDGIIHIFNVIKSKFKYSKLPHPDFFQGKELSLEPTSVIRDSLIEYCSLLDKPLVLFFDEIDSLSDDALVAFLRQLRDGYITRNSIPFPSSIALVGMRNIRDYKGRIRADNQTFGSASPFNIIAESITIKSFSRQEIELLYSQHTSDTGQIFEIEAIDAVYEQTSGQPWLVNAIAREAVTKILDSDFSKPINAPIVHQAIQNIILRRDTHIDSLLFKLKEPRVQTIMESVILGKKADIYISSDNTAYCIDLGLIKAVNGELLPSNNIYKEIIIRELTADSQFNLQALIKNIWIENDQINMDSLLKSFQVFWRENSDIWIEKFDYKEAAPHLILQAFLQRVINGGGEIIREYASNRDRIDLCVMYKSTKYPIELKILRNTKSIPTGIEQLLGYMDTLGEPTGWLVVFDRNPKHSWEQKISWETVVIEEKTVHIVKC